MESLPQPGRMAISAEARKGEVAAVEEFISWASHRHQDSRILGASPTDPASNGQPDVEDLEAGSMGRSLVHPLEEAGYFLPATATLVLNVEPRRHPPPLVAGGDRSSMARH
jgi:hypothetical protein